MSYDEMAKHYKDMLKDYEYMSKRLDEVKQQFKELKKQDLALRKYIFELGGSIQGDSQGLEDFYKIYDPDDYLNL